MSVPTEPRPVFIRPKVCDPSEYVPCGDPAIDDYITSTVTDYEQHLENGNLNAFRNSVFKDKIKIACYGLGKSQDPADHEKSKDLWAKRLIRALARVTLAGDPNQSEVKHIVPIEPYWRDVHDKFQDEVLAFTRRQDGIVVPYHLDFSTDSDYTYEPMAEVRDFRIYGRAVIRGGLYIHADYLAQHASLPINE